MNDSQRRAIAAYRGRLAERGIVRVQLLIPSEDREILQAAAQCLSKGGADAERMRDALRNALEPSDAAGSTKGRLLRALLQAPQLDFELKIPRSRELPRPLDL